MEMTLEQKRRIVTHLSDLADKALDNLVGRIDRKFDLQRDATRGDVLNLSSYGVNIALFNEVYSNWNRAFEHELYFMRAMDLINQDQFVGIIHAVIDAIRYIDRWERYVDEMKWTSWRSVIVGGLRAFSFEQRIRRILLTPGEQFELEELERREHELEQKQQRVRALLVELPWQSISKVFKAIYPSFKGNKAQWQVTNEVVAWLVVRDNVVIRIEAALAGRYRGKGERNKLIVDMLIERADKEHRIKKEGA